MRLTQRCGKSRGKTWVGGDVTVAKVATPKPTLSVADAVAIIVGIVIGTGIFKTPSLVAANTANEAFFLLAWLIGGMVSFVGALCYAELTTTYPHSGGEYHFLLRSFGREVAFLFAWARATVIQTGSIAMLGFVFGDYASQLFSLGKHSPAIYAALAVVILTSLNLVGVQQGKWTQNVFAIGRCRRSYDGCSFRAPFSARQAVLRRVRFGDDFRSAHLRRMERSGLHIR